MEDCWDQDAEARLTAQCAEERLSELSLLNTHTATHNHRYTHDNPLKTHSVYLRVPADLYRCGIVGVMALSFVHW